MTLGGAEHRKGLSSGRGRPDPGRDGAPSGPPPSSPAADLFDVLFRGEVASQEALRYVEESGQLGLWAWDLAAERMIWSRGLFQILGYEPGEVEPSCDAIATLIHPDDQLRPGELERTLRHGLSISREFRLIRRNGRMRWLANRGETLRDAGGEPSRAIGMMIDVTERAEAGLAAKASDELFQALVQASAAQAWTTDADGGRGGIAALDCAGSPPGQRPPYPAALPVIHPDDRAECQRSWSRARAEKSVLSTECRVRSEDGPDRWVRLRAAPVVEAGGRVREWVWVAFDLERGEDRPLLQAPHLDEADPPPMTGAQLRAARGCLNWSVRDLSEASGVSPSVIRRLEEFDAAGSTRETCVEDLRRSLQRAGIEFLFPSSGKPGIRPR